MPRRNSLSSALILGAGTFVTAILFTLLARFFLSRLNSLLLAFVILFFIILVGILFDIIGISVTAADETPFHAKGAKKITGSKQAIRLVRNADKVASFSNDVVGDIAGTVSGALGAAIIFQLVKRHPHLDEFFLSIIMTGLVAATTVGGKALGKSLAIHRAEDVVFQVARVLAWLENLVGYSGKRKKRAGRNGLRRRK